MELITLVAIKNLDKRLKRHEHGVGANYTRKRLPIKLVYYETFSRIDFAFNREKQVQGWSHKKKEALIHKNYKELHYLSKCINDSLFGSAQ